MDQASDSCIRFKRKNLKELSAFCLSAYLWDSPNIRQEIEDYGNEIYGSNNWKDVSRTRWWEITQKILNRVDSFKLTEQPLLELRNIIIFMGEKIFHWFVEVIRKFITRELDCDFKYLREIYWTSDGLINESKIFESWMKDRSLSGSKSKVFIMACKHADEESFDALLKEIEGFMVVFAEKEIPSVEEALRTLVMDYLDSYLGFKPPSEVLSKEPYFSLFNALKNISLPFFFSFRFSLFLFAGFENCIKFEYQNLNDEQKEIVFEIFLSKFKETKEQPLPDPTRDLKARLTCYFLNHLPYEAKKSVLFDQFENLFETFIITWPYQNLCTGLLNFVWNDLPVKSHKNLLEITLISLIKFFFEYNNVYKWVQRQLLKDILPRISFHEKMYILCYSGKIFEFFKMSDFSTIHLLLADDKIDTYYRSTMLDISIDLPSYFSEFGGTFEKLKEYVEQVNLTEKEKDRLLDSYLLQSLVLKGQFQVVDEILNFKYNSDVRKVIRMKNRLLNYRTGISIFESGDGDLTDKYLEWHCRDKPEKWEALDKKIHTTEFIRICFWNLWIWNCKEDLELAKKQCLKILKYLLKTDDEVNSFMKEKIIENEGFVERFCYNYYLAAGNNRIFLYEPGGKTYSISQIESFYWIDLNEVFKFCSVSSEKVSEIKRKIKNDFDSWFGKTWFLRFHYTKPKVFLILNSLIKWLCDTKEEEDIIIKKIMNPVDRFYFDSKGLEYSFEVHKKWARRVHLNDWLVRFDNVEELKKMYLEEKSK